VVRGVIVNRSIARIASTPMARMPKAEQYVRHATKRPSGTGRERGSGVRSAKATPTFMSRRPTGGGMEAIMAITATSSTRIHEAERAPSARTPGILLFALAAQFMTVIMLAASMAPGYDVAGGAISDLGVISETAIMFNLSLIAVGALNIVAGYLLYRIHDRRWILGLYLLAGLGAAGAGLVPLDASDAHGMFALTAFLFFNIQAIASGTLVEGPMRAVSYLGGIAGLIFVIVMVIGDAGTPAVFGPIGHGGAERMIVYPAMLWMIAFGGYLMAEPRIGPSA
jgi:hypothetical membrane protein